MQTKIACVSCGEFFEPEVEEVQEFIAGRADGKFLKRIVLEIQRCSSNLSQYRMQSQGLGYGKTIKDYLVLILMAYCPYCREVKFSKVACPNLPSRGHARGKLSEEKYLRAFRREINRNGGFQIRPIPEDYITLAKDEN